MLLLFAPKLNAGAVPLFLLLLVLLLLEPTLPNVENDETLSLVLLPNTVLLLLSFPSLLSFSSSKDKAEYSIQIHKSLRAENYSICTRIYSTIQ